MKAIACTRKYAVIALCSLLALPAVSQENSILGNWETESTQKDGKVPLSSITLSIERESQGDRVVGTFCYIYNYGRRIDCPNSDEKNVEGTISADEKSARLRVQRTYENTESAAVVAVRLEGSQLRYTQLDADGDSYLKPKAATLSRSRDDGRCAVHILSDKAFFHRRPDASTRRSAYVIRQDMVVALGASRDGAFIYSSYVSDRGHETSGWLTCDAVGLCFGQSGSPPTRCDHLNIIDWTATQGFAARRNAETSHG